MATVNTTTHTPGPWTANIIGNKIDPTDQELAVTIPKKNNTTEIQRIICVLSKEKKIDLQDLANAQLIAAAPEMLNNLNQVLSIIQSSEGVAGYHLNGDVATWEEVGLGNIVSLINAAEGKEATNA